MSPRHFVQRLLLGCFGIVVAPWLWGCASPGAAPADPSTTAEASSPWLDAARATAQQTLAQLDKNGVASNARLAVVLPAQPSALEVLLSDGVVSEVLRSGRRVTQNPDNPLKLSLHATPTGPAVAGAPGEVLVTARTLLGDQIVAQDSRVLPLARFDPALFLRAPAHPSLKVVNQ